MKNKLILIPLLVIFIVVNSKAQSYFRFLTWTQEEIVACTEIIITKDWINPIEGNRMFSIIVEADIPRTGLLHINKVTGKVEIYSLDVTGVEREILRNITEMATVNYIEKFKWIEPTFHDMVDIQKIDGRTYVSFYDLDSQK